MKALSFTQPWLWAILHGGKRIENRVAWKGCSYRGPILLHAAKSVGTREEFDDTAESILMILDKADEVAGSYTYQRFIGDCLELSCGSQTSLSGPVGEFWRPQASLRRGGIVGLARIVGVVRDEESFRDFERSAHNPGGQRPWWFGGFALVLADVEPLPFVAWKGALGLFEVPEDYATRAAP
ncbi:MAG TPA: hypothetical protein VGQ38_15450 [Gaiellaceae bacterium]|nr:hypothetical protein [Gaiellaceae bacterium]